MKVLKKTIITMMLTSMLTVLLCAPVFAGVSQTKKGPVFTVTAKDTAMNATINAGQTMTVKNKVGADLELFVDNVYVGYIENGTSGGMSSNINKNLTAVHQVMNGMHVLMVASSAAPVVQPVVAPAAPVNNAQQIAAIDAQINQLCVYYQQAQAVGNTELMNTSLQLVQVLNAQKAALMQK